MDCFGTYFTHAQTCYVTRVQSATQWTASVHTLHMPKPVIEPVFKVLRNVTCDILCYCLLGSISFLTPSQHVSHLNTFDLLCQTLLINGWTCGLWRDLVFWSFSVQCSTCRIFFGKLDASILEVSSSISSMAKRAAGQLPDVGLSAWNRFLLETM